MSDAYAIIATVLWDAVQSLVWRSVVYTNVLIRCGGLACLVGSMLAALASLLEEPSIPPSLHRVAAILNLASVPMLHAGLVALYLKARVHSDHPGKSGRIWLLMGPLIYTVGFLLLWSSWSPVFAFGLIGYLGGLLLLAYGLVLVGIANMRANLLGRLSGMPVLVGALILPFTLFGGYAASSDSSVGRVMYLAIAMTWWASWALMGYSLYTDKVTEEPRALENAI